MDVSNAFSHGDLDEEIYMTLPPDMLLANDQRVWRLRKSLYGLKKANKNWYQKITTSLQTFGYTQSSVNYTLFFKYTSTSYTCLLIYVDDLIISRDDEKKIIVLKSHLQNQFHIKDLGKLKYFLGIEVSQFSLGIFISLRKYSIPMKHHSSSSFDDPFDEWSIIV